LLLSRMAVPVLFYLSERREALGKERAAGPAIVLCAVDFGAQSALALKYAEVIAEAVGYGLKVLHALPDDVPAYFTESQIEAVGDEEERTRNEALSALSSFTSDHLSPNTKAELLVAHGSPSGAIQSELNRLDYQLLVIGTKSRTGFDRFVFGSVAEAVLDESDVPTVAIGPGVDDARPVRLGKVLVLVERSEPSLNALRFATELARRSGAELATVYVAAPEDNTEASDLMRFCSDLIPSVVRAECTVDHIIRRGEAPDRIVSDEASAGGFDLVVIGVERKLFGDEAFGQTVREIISSAPCPVVVVHQDVPNGPYSD
jgi:nucleotide-binding universal stress UspA family protein